MIDQGFDMITTLVIFLAALLAGGALHSLDGYYNFLTPRMGMLARYASGVVCVFPFALVLFDPVDEYEFVRYTWAYFMGFGWFGAGVFILDWVQVIREIRQSREEIK